MRTIKIAYYKNSKTFFAKLIRFQQYRIHRYPWTTARYSHVELVFEDGTWFSSSELDGGVRAKKIKDDKNHWDYIEIKVNDRNYKIVRKWCENKTGNKYNMLGIFFSQVINTRWFLGREDYFCSEFCTKALQQIKMLCGEDAVGVSPAKLYDLTK